MADYYLIGETVFRSSNHGAIGQDGNPQRVAYETWIAVGNTPGDGPPA